MKESLHLKKHSVEYCDEELGYRLTHALQTNGAAGKSGSQPGWLACKTGRAG